MLPSFTTSLAVFVACAVIGAMTACALARRLECRFAPADPLVGVGLAGGAVTVLGAAAPLSLPVWIGAAGLIAVAAAGWLARRRHRPGGRGQWLALVFMLPLLILAADAPATHWDGLRQWLPNVVYLDRYDSFPHPDLPESRSFLPAYPYGVPLFVYAASLLAGRFVESAGALFNLLLLAAFVPVLLGIVEETRRERFGPEIPPLSRMAIIAVIGVGVPAVTVLSPSFDPYFTFTALADVPTAVATALCGVLAWLMLERLAGGRRAEAGTLAWQFGFTAALLINLKQANPVLLALLLGAAALVVLRDPRLRAAEAMRLLPAMLLPALIVYLAWRAYVTAYIPTGEVGAQPVQDWNIAVIGETIAAMGRQMVAHPLHFGLMFVLSGVGLAALYRMRDGLDRLLVIVSAVWLGYTAFMLFAYVALFAEWEARIAAEYWRYSTHAGLLGQVAVAAMLVRWWPERLPRVPVLAAALAVAVAFPLGVLRTPGAVFDADEGLRRWFRTVGQDVAERLPVGSRVALIAPMEWSLFGIALDYDLNRPGADDRDLRVARHIGLTAADLERARSFWDDPGITHIVITDPTPEFAQALGVPPGPEQAFLLSRGEDGWRISRTWVRPQLAPFPTFPQQSWDKE